jgi:thiosulfate/3-mercaptopyruvate sulfurtransferase
MDGGSAGFAGAINLPCGIRSQATGPIPCLWPLTGQQCYNLKLKTYNLKLITPMSQANYLIEPDELEAIRGNENIVIIDLCKAKQYAQAHIPDAHFVNYIDIVKIDKPVMGLLPDNENFSALLSSLGVTKKSLIVAYDDEGGGCAARFVWTLHVFGHETAVILNGGLHSWANTRHQTNLKPVVIS